MTTDPVLKAAQKSYMAQVLSFPTEYKVMLYGGSVGDIFPSSCHTLP